MRDSGRASLGVAAVAALLGAGVLALQNTPALAATSTVSELFAQLPVQAEVHEDTYDRDFFNHWIDEDSDTCDTREEVLIAESVVAPTVEAGCTVTAGQWDSWYDAATWTLPGDVDIDHLVPLAESWSSGASAWTYVQRQAFANDLDFEPSLAAVTDSVNQSKGAGDPAEWLPPDGSVHCRYVTEWVLVKYRWHLAVDTAEADAISSVLTGACGDTVVTVPDRAEVPEPTPAAATFFDVPLTHGFFEDIEWLAATGLTGGYPDGGFHPTAPVSRQVMAAFLYRYSHDGADPEPCSSKWFWDVPVSSPFCGHITWLGQTGIAGGYSDGGFHPTASVSRQTMAVFLEAYRGDAAVPCQQDLFTDMPDNEFCAAITWLKSSGVASGFPDGSFRPTTAVSRQAMAAFLHSYDTSFGPSDPPIVVVNPPTTTTTTAPPPPPPPPPPNPGDTKNCGDFATWSAAQTWFNTYFPYYGDVAHLDADGDGIACESLPGAP